MTRNIIRNTSVIQIAVFSYRHHNSTICLIISLVSELWWLCEVNLRTNQMYIFSDNTLFGHFIGHCSATVLNSYNGSEM